MSTDTEAATVVASAAPAIADPAPLGLAAFALTTFLLSAINAGLAKTSTGFDWWGYAIAYGGLGQLLAGMWEFKNKNVFGATAFSTYGGFWIGVGLWLHFIAPTAKNPVELNRDLGWILLAFAIFNTYMLIISLQLNMAVFLVFLTLELTEIFLFLGNFTTKAFALPPDPTNSGLIVVGGYLGILTALCAWYASAAGVINGLKGGVVFPVGKPLMDFKVRA
ncbi:MAG TPA: acetate uptake transporter [Streptosporangiaceae bacterium]|nr:acetate uptake transporter [Streptosporangiaceae bacterium]